MYIDRFIVFSHSHLHFLRETFRQMGQCDSNTSDPVSVSSLSRSDSGNSVMFSRQTTVECFQVRK